MTVVVASPDYPHWPAVARLIHDAFAWMTPHLGHPARAMSVDAAALGAAARAGTALLVERTAEPVACAFTRPSRDVPGALYLGWLAVARAARGQGLGEALIDAALVHARAGGYESLTLDTGRTLHGLHGYFHQIGFIVHGETDTVTTFIRPTP